LFLSTQIAETTTIKTTRRTTTLAPGATTTPRIIPEWLLSLRQKVPQSPHCGVEADVRIVGGEKVDVPGQPWTVLVKVSNNEGRSKFVCGGTLINDQYVVTGELIRIGVTGGMKCAIFIQNSTSRNSCAWQRGFSAFLLWPITQAVEIFLF
jgi:hypothetical protein